MTVEYWLEKIKSGLNDLERIQMLVFYYVHPYRRGSRFAQLFRHGADAMAQVAEVFGAGASIQPLTSLKRPL